MKLPNQQRGAAMWQMCLYIFVFLFVVTVALKLGPLYIQDRSIQSALVGVSEMVHGGDDLTTSTIKDNLSKTFQVSMIDDSLLSNLSIDRSGGSVVLNLDYDARTPFVANIEVIVHFKHSVNLSVR